MPARRKIALYTAVTIIFLFSFLPFLGMAVMSVLSETEMAVRGFTLTPERGFTGRNYLVALKLLIVPLGGQTELGRLVPVLGHSLIVATSASIIAITISVFSGYALGRFRFRGRSAFLLVFLASRFLPPITIIMPIFAWFNGIGLNGTYHGLVLAQLATITPLLTWVLTGHFASLPVETEMLARADGCGRLQALRHVVIPMGGAGIFASWILGFLLSWNEFLFSLLLTGGTDIRTLQPVIVNMGGGWGTSSALVMLGMLPPLALALAFQRFITRLNIVGPN